MTLSLRLSRGETPGWIYSPSTPGFFFTGGYCCKVATASYFVFGGNRIGGLAVSETTQWTGLTWIARAIMPQNGRFDLGTANLPDAVLCVGGIDIQPSNSCLTYSPRTDQWNATVQIPGAARYAVASVGNGQYAFSFAGRNALHQNTSDSFIFYGHYWFVTTNVPVPARSRATAVSLNSVVYLSCGTSEIVDLLNDHLEFAHLSSTWVNRTSVPPPARQGHAGFATSSRVVLAGGGIPLSTVAQAFDPISNAWMGLVDLSLPARQWCASGTGNRANNGFVTGGEAGGGVRVSDHDEYIDGVWVAQQDLPLPSRKQLAGATR